MPPRRRESNNLSPLGQALQAWINTEKLNQDVSAKLIGVSPRTLSDWMTNGKQPDQALMVAKLAALLGTTVEGLLDCEDALAPLRNRTILREMVRGAAMPHVFVRYLACQERKAEVKPESKIGRRRARRWMKRARRTK